MIKRLMSKFVTQLFIDKVNGRPVNLYECKDGSKFMAHSKLDSIIFYTPHNEINS